MHTGVIRHFGDFKKYSVVYLVLALPMAYYSINYISLVKDHMSVTLPLFALVMAMSVAGACFVQSRTLKRISLFLKGDNQILIADFETSLMKKDAYALPARLSAVMLFGWVVLLNLFVFIPSFMFLEASAADFIVCNMLSLSSGLMSLDRLADRGKSGGFFLELRSNGAPNRRKPPHSLTTKLLIVYNHRNSFSTTWSPFLSVTRFDAAGNDREHRPIAARGGQHHHYFAVVFPWYACVAIADRRRVAQEGRLSR